MDTKQRGNDGRSRVSSFLAAVRPSFSWLSFERKGSDKPLMDAPPLRSVFSLLTGNGGGWRAGGVGGEGRKA